MNTGHALKFGVFSFAMFLSFGVHADSQTDSAVPDWLFPVAPATSAVPGNDQELVNIPGSHEKYTAARINDPFHPPDWHPEQHAPMPQIVAFGRSPNVMACAFCHTPTGQGRPENAALAGLSADYLRQQLKDFRSGDRSAVGPPTYLPIRAMVNGSLSLTDAEIEAAAEYFSRQTLAPRVQVVEAKRIPKVMRAGWVYVRDPAGGEESLEDRLIEVAPDLTRHERRDDRMQYVAYVPAGSIARGRKLASADSASLQCATCHGAGLRGSAIAPAIAGRSPTSLARQMFAFRERTRSGPQAQLMRPVTAKLDTSEIVALAAYVSSLPP